MNDYEKALEAIKEMPRFTLGDEVSTPIGKGIIVSLEMPSNGLYLSPERATAIVWFSTAESTNGWVQKEFSVKELFQVFKIDLKKATADKAADIIEKCIAISKQYRNLAEAKRELKRQLDIDIDIDKRIEKERKLRELETKYKEMGEEIQHLRREV